MSYFKNSKNQASFIGNIGQDVEVKEGSKSTRFSIGTTVVSGKDEAKKEKTIWIPLEIWNDHPALPFLKKGKQISVEGFYSTSESGEGDDKKYYHVFKVNELLLLGGTKASEE